MENQITTLENEIKLLRKWIIRDIIDHFRFLTNKTILPKDLFYQTFYNDIDIRYLPNGEYRLVGIIDEEIILDERGEVPPPDTVFETLMVNRYGDDLKHILR